MRPCAALLLPILAAGCGEAEAPAERPEPLTGEAARTFRYDTATVRPATYWAGLASLANPIMFAGLGRELSFSMDQRDEWLERAGYAVRPAMGGVAVVGAVYRSGDPAFVVEPDFADPATLRWDSTTFDRTLEPAAQAWSIVKIASPEFHLQYHELKENRLAALMMIPQAHTQARVLEEELSTPAGLFAARSPEGRLGTPVPRDQVAVLTAVATLLLAATSEREDYWHDAWRDLVDAGAYRSLADRAFEAVGRLPPDTPGGRGLGIEALARYSLVAPAPEARRARDLARRWAEALAADPGATLEDVALAVYGLVEASRLLAEPACRTRAGEIFRETLLPLWDEDAGVFRNGPERERIVYTPTTVAAVVAALDAVRWFGSAGERERARALHPVFFENAMVRSGLLRSSPLPLVQTPYLADARPEVFAHPLLPSPADAGVAPVVAGEVVREDGRWRVTEPRFRTAEALFLSVMLSIRSEEGRADSFLPGDRLPDPLADEGVP